jgi:hypothetical protein
MGRVESGRLGGGTVNPWPWTVNAAGSGHFYPTKRAAEDAVRQFLAAGVKSLDVGCLQVNLFYHPGAFATLEQAFDPAVNAAYAAKMLVDLFRSTGSWPRAAAAYHSMTPAIGLAYQQKVLEQWATPDRPSMATGPDASQAEALDAGERRGRKAAHPPGQTDSRLAGGPTTSPAASAAMPPSVGFNRRFMLAQPHLATARTLAAYRAAPVQFASHLPGAAAQPLR